MIVASKKNIQINRALLKSINQPINQPISQSINQPTNSATNKHTYKQAFNQENEWAKKITLMQVKLTIKYHRRTHLVVEDGAKNG